MAPITLGPYPSETAAPIIQELRVLYMGFQTETGENATECKHD